MMTTPGTGLRSVPIGNLVASARSCVHHEQSDVPDAYYYTALKLPKSVASINRLVVDRAWRNLGIARALDLVRLEAAKDSGAECVVCATSGPRITALGKLGFCLTSHKGYSCYLQGFFGLSHGMATAIIVTRWKREMTITFGLPTIAAAVTSVSWSKS